MDIKKFPFLLLSALPRRPIWSDLGGPPIWRNEGVLVTSTLRLLSQFLNNSCYRYKELSFFCAFIKIYPGNVKFEKLTANKFEGIFTSLRQVANLLQNERQISPLLSRLQSSHLL